MQIKTGVFVAIAIILIIVAGLAGYYAGVSSVVPVTKTITVTQVVTAVTTPTPTLTTPTILTPSPTTPIKLTIRMGTLKVGSTGYMISVYLSDIWKRELGYDIYVYPYPSTDAIVKDHALGNLEMSYANDLLLLDFYTNGKTFGFFVGALDVAKKYPAVAVWVYPMWTHVVVPADKAEQYRCWSDLNGKKGFLTPKGFGNHVNMLRILRALGINVTHVELPLSGAKVKEALDRGEIDFVAVYTAGKTIAPWVAELDMLMKLKPVNLCSHEIEKLKATGIPVIMFDAKDFYKNNKDMGTVTAIPTYFLWTASGDVPEDYVYNMLKALEKVIKEYAKLVPELGIAAEDFAKFQAEATKAIAAYKIPIHPGLAKYLKEKGLWKSEWEPLILKH
jgi:hypothetical protein